MGCTGLALSHLPQRPNKKTLIQNTYLESFSKRATLFARLFTENCPVRHVSKLRNFCTPLARTAHSMLTRCCSGRAKAPLRSPAFQRGY